MFIDGKDYMLRFWFVLASVTYAELEVWPNVPPYRRRKFFPLMTGDFS